MKGYTAITGWVADVSAADLADLYLRAGAIPAGPPSKTTIWRVVTDADPEMLDAAVGTWLMNVAGLAAPAVAGADDCMPGRGALTQVRVDGKAIRGAKDADGSQVRLLAALAGPDAAAPVVAAQDLGMSWSWRPLPPGPAPRHEHDRRQRADDGCLCRRDQTRVRSCRPPRSPAAGPARARCAGPPTHRPGHRRCQRPAAARSGGTLIPRHRPGGPKPLQGVLVSVGGPLCDRGERRRPARHPRHPEDFADPLAAGWWRRYPDR